MSLRSEQFMSSITTFMLLLLPISAMSLPFHM